MLLGSPGSKSHSMDTDSLEIRLVPAPNLLSAEQGFAGLPGEPPLHPQQHLLWGLLLGYSSSRFMIGFRSQRTHRRSPFGS